MMRAVTVSPFYVFVPFRVIAKKLKAFEQNVANAGKEGNCSLRLGGAVFLLNVFKL